jgi:LysM repeat protein
VHTVQRGETLYCLGRAYLVNPLAIAARNGLAASNFIYPGQRLVIPGERWTSIPAGRICFRQFALPDTLSTPQPGATPAPVPTLPASTQCQIRYTIRYGDTLWSIARRYGKSPWALATYNHILNPDLIFVGDVLCIP